MASLGSINPHNLQPARPVSTPPLKAPRKQFPMMGFIIFILLGLCGLLGFQNWQLKQQPLPTTYETCIAAQGSIIQESYPATCVTAKGDRFVQPTPYELTPTITESPISTPAAAACTLEAKLCPDGSAVGRSGPNCEFAPCPSY
jgi:hypothetical protein